MQVSTSLMGCGSYTASQGEACQCVRADGSIAPTQDEVQAALQPPASHKRRAASRRQRRKRRAKAPRGEL